jgi:hypothetical protein
MGSDMMMALVYKMDDRSRRKSWLPLSLSILFTSSSGPTFFIQYFMQGA